MTQKEKSFWREVAVNVVSGVLLSFALFIFSQIPIVLHGLQTVMVKLKTASFDPEVVVPLQKYYLKRGDPNRSLAVSSDISFSDGSIGSGAYKEVAELRTQAKDRIKQYSKTEGVAG